MNSEKIINILKNKFNNIQNFSDIFNLHFSDVYRIIYLHDKNDKIEKIIFNHTGIKIHDIRLKIYKQIRTDLMKEVKELIINSRNFILSDLKNNIESFSSDFLDNFINSDKIKKINYYIVLKKLLDN